jgi:hypothetical protein
MASIVLAISLAMGFGCNGGWTPPTPAPVVAR